MSTTFSPAIKARFTCLLLTALMIMYSAASTAAERDMTIKVATIAPKGSIYHRVLQEVGGAWREAQGGKSRFIIYPDGSQGSEANTVRRMRIGQLDASMLSVAGLKEIDPYVTGMQLMPLVFRSWGEFDYVHKQVRPELERRLREKGFEVLFWGEGGWVQFFSTVPRMTPEDYKSARIFTWAGTPSQIDMMKSLDYHPVVLGLSDILASLQTGMIDTVPAAPMWALAFQFYVTTPHMLRMNWVPIVGATVMTTKTWKAMRPEARDAIRSAAVEASATLRAHRAAQDEDAIRAMQARGLSVHEPSPEVDQQWQDLVRGVWPHIRGTMVPAEMFDRVQELLVEYRKQKP